MKLSRIVSTVILMFTFCCITTGCDKAKDPAPATGSEPKAGTPEALTHKLLTERFRPDGAGAAVLVARNGKILFERGYGLADIARGTPVTPATKFRIGSLTKQFTAAGVLRLQESGKLSVKDTLSRYYPDFPRASEVTLHHMLSHTSGIHNVVATRFYEQNCLSAVTPETVIATFASQPFTFDPGKPGKSWGYTNSPYFLMSEIIAKVSGQSYGDYLQQSFFGPLEMKNTGVYRDDKPPTGLAVGYEYREGGFRPAVIWHSSWLGGAGVLYSDLRDMHRWYEGIFGTTLLSANSRKAMWTTYSTARNLRQFSDFDYGYGWVIARVRGARELSHAGAVPGFICNAIRLPDYDLTVVVLENAFPPRAGTDPIALSREIACLFLDAELPPVSASQPAVAGDGPAIEVTPSPLGL